MTKDRYQILRKELVDNHIRKTTNNKRVLDVFLDFPRHLFVPKEALDEAYMDKPLPIGVGQTISQPSLVALMTDLLSPSKKDIVLEIGTGSGYQAGILAKLTKRVYTIERIPQLAHIAKSRLKRLGYKNVEVLTANGTLGYPAHAPYDAIIVTAASPTIPKPLVKQLKEGGRIIVPVGREGSEQHLILGKKKRGRLYKKDVELVRFVPLIGKYGTNLA